jgi:hypothetical protein
MYIASDVSSPVNNIMHARLQYTNQDGIYVNPKSSLATAIWYFYSPKNNHWFWTPYKPYKGWMSVGSCTVKSGFHKSQIPARKNVEIIKYLRKTNPIPPDTVVRDALEAENRILNL